jgi:hypothetical protein
MANTLCAANAGVALYAQLATVCWQYSTLLSLQLL